MIILLLYFIDNNIRKKKINKDVNTINKRKKYGVKQHENEKKESVTKIFLKSAI